MRLKFGVNFTLNLTRDSHETAPDREGDASSHVERSPAEDLRYEDLNRVAPQSKPVLGFVADERRP